MTKRASIRLLLLSIPILSGMPGLLDAQDSLSLSEAMRRAIHENGSVQESRWRLEAERENLRQAFSNLLPSVAATGEYAAYQEPTLVGQLTNPRTPPPLDDQIYAVALRIDAPLVNLPGWAGIAAARNGLTAAESRHTVVGQSVAAAVAELYLNNQELLDRAALLNARIEALDQRYTEARLLHSEGRLSRGDLAAIGSILASLRSDRLELEGRQRELTYRLQEILGAEEPVRPQPFSVDRNALGSVPRPWAAAEGASAAGKVPSAAGEGPRTAAANARLAAAEAELTAARLSFAPTLSGYFMESARSGSDLDLEPEWSAGLRLTVPLATGGERLSATRRMEATVTAARHAREAAELSEETATERSRLTYEYAQLRRPEVEESIEMQTEAVAALRDRYRGGVSSLSELLSEETKLLELRLAGRALRYTEIRAVLSYYETVGELTPELIASLLEE